MIWFSKRQESSLFMRGSVSAVATMDMNHVLCVGPMALSLQGEEKRSRCDGSANGADERQSRPRALVPRSRLRMKWEWWGC